jgi:hypothetical protein
MIFLQHKNRLLCMYVPCSATPLPKEPVSELVTGADTQTVVRN